MKTRFDSILEKLFYFFAFVVIAYLILGYIYMPSERQNHFFTSNRINLKWYQVKENGEKELIELPGTCEAEKGKKVTITATLPKSFDMDDITTWLCFRTSKQDMTFYIDGKYRDRYSTNKTRLWGKNSVSVYFFLPLKEADFGKDITVTFWSNSDYAGIVRDVYYGTSAGLMYRFIKENIVENIFGVFLVSLAVISIFVSMILNIKMKRIFYLGYLGWGVLFISLWILFQSPIRQFYMPNVSLSNDMTYFSLYIGLVPIAIFLNNVQKFRYNKIYRGIICASMTFFIVASILQMEDILEFAELLPMSMTLQIMGILIAIGTLLIDYRNGYIKEYKLITIGFIGLAISGIVQILMYFPRVAIYKGMFICMGSVFLLIMTVISTIKDFVLLEQGAKESQLKNEKLTYQIMETLVHTIEAKDEYTKGHSARVAKYSQLIAERMGLSEEEQKSIYFMGMLHDIGKIGIADKIINKRGKLSEKEYGAIKSHSMIGYNILKNMAEIKDIEYGARWHHERYDGKGYPDGLSGEEIPLYARIIAASDAYDAMTSNRSYRKILSQDKVRSEIENGMGIQFDPDVAKCVLEIIDEDTEYVLKQGVES